MLFSVVSFLSYIGILTLQGKCSGDSPIHQELNFSRNSQPPRRNTWFYLAHQLAAHYISSSHPGQQEVLCVLRQHVDTLQNGSFQPHSMYQVFFDAIHALLTVLAVSPRC